VRLLLDEVATANVAVVVVENDGQKDVVLCSLLIVDLIGIV
jgi:hypothetical protein